jgi:hypothetical protein
VGFKIGSHGHLGHYAFVMDNGQHDIITQTELSEAHPKVIEARVRSCGPHSG